MDAPDETIGIDFTLEKGGSITGQVVDEKGNPINWVYVYAYDSSGKYAGYGEIDFEGLYTLQGLATGGYYIEISSYKCGLREWYQDARPF